MQRRRQQPQRPKEQLPDGWVWAGSLWDRMPGAQPDPPILLTREQKQRLDTAEDERIYDCGD